MLKIAITLPPFYMRIPTNITIKPRIWQTKKNSVKFFLYTIILCIILSFLFLQPVLKNGLTGDDWQLLFAYKTFDPQPLNRILDVWMVRGPYTTIQFYYIGLLEVILGHNLQLFQITNIFFKIFVSITLFLLISKIFKDYLLASISAVMFSIIHSSAGALVYVVKGTEYLSMGFMNLFFIFYYYSVTENSLMFTFFTSIILVITFMLSPIRMYPLFGLIFLIEIYLVLKNKRISYLVQSFFRLTIFYLPAMFLAVVSIGTTRTHLNGTINLINEIRAGNYQLFLSPLKGLGYSLFGNDQLKFLEIWKLFDPNSPITAASVIGVLILACSIGYFTIWIKNGSKPDKSLILFIGPSFAFFFLVSTWLILGLPFGFADAVDRYLVVPSLGISIFISALICLFYEVGLGLKSGVNRYTYIFISFSLIIALSSISYHEISRHFNFLLSLGTGASDQNYMQNQILTSINKQDQPNLIIYLEGLLDDPKNVQYNEVSVNLGYLEHWLLYFKKPEFSGCITVVTDESKLREFYKVDMREYFEADGFCAQTRFKVETMRGIYNIEDFRAFLFKERRIYNITDQMLRDLRSRRTSLIGD